jgi:TetR/AcrR family transcriptional regulator, transcriptional repressor of bet genes
VPRPPRISKAELADALLGVVAEQGLDAVSVRSVARVAGVSGGAVQYHFPTVKELRRAAYQRVIDRVTARAERRAAEATSAKAFVRALLLELLPLDDERRTEVQAGLAFSARSVHSPDLAELYAEGYRALVGALEDALRAAAGRGEAATGVDPRRDAVAAAAVADGLAWHLVCAPAALAADEAVRALDAHLDRLRPG